MPKRSWRCPVLFRRSSFGSGATGWTSSVSEPALTDGGDNSVATASPVKRGFLSNRATEPGREGSLGVIKGRPAKSRSRQPRPYRPDGGPDQRHEGPTVHSHRASAAASLHHKGMTRPPPLPCAQGRRRHHLVRRSEERGAVPGLRYRYLCPGVKARYEHPRQPERAQGGRLAESDSD